MNRTVFFIRVFVTLLKLYPIPFRSEFEEEMQTVFTAKVMDRANEGLAILTTACLREYFDLLHNLPYEYLTAFGKGGDMSQKGRIFIILSGCLFFASAVLPWASLETGSTVESFDNPSVMPLIVTGGLILAASLINSGNFTKTISILTSMIGLGWGVYSGASIITYFLNGPWYAQNSYTVNLGPSLILTLFASILAFSFGLFQLSLINKHPNILTLSQN
jgi:uncharacterized membrane protein